MQVVFKGGSPVPAVLLVNKVDLLRDAEESFRIGAQFEKASLSLCVCVCVCVCVRACVVCVPLTLHSLLSTLVCKLRLTVLTLAADCNGVWIQSLVYNFGQDGSQH